MSLTQSDIALIEMILDQEKISIKALASGCKVEPQGAAEAMMTLIEYARLQRTQNKILTSVMNKWRDVL